MAQPVAPRTNPTLAGELERLAGLLKSSNEINGLAEDVASQLAGPFPVPGFEADESSQPGYLTKFRRLLDELEVSQGRAKFALNLTMDSLTGPPPDGSASIGSRKIELTGHSTY